MKKMLSYMAGAILVIVCVTSCSPRIVEHVRTQIEYRDRVQRDSIYFRDSVFVSEKVTGDTVYIDRFKYKYIYRDKYKTDTLLREVHDTTAVQVPVEKPLSAWKSAKLGAFWWLVAALVTALVYIFRKPILKLLRICIPL